ncbi:MAG: secretion protein [Myxococcales bacterium]|jgi:type III secretion protein J
MKRVVVIAFVVLGGCEQKIQHDLDEMQANEIEALLHEAGVEARKVRGGGRDAKWTIAVPAGSTTAAIKLLDDHDLPRKQAPGFAEVFGKGSMVPTATEENALYIHALAGELSQTLTALEGVVNARVHIVAAPASAHSGFRRETQPRASVLLKAKNGKAEALTARRGEIQALVAGSVEGLSPESVAVMVSELPPAPVPSAASPSTRTARWPLVLAAVLVALLSIALAFALLHLRRLRQRMGAQGAQPTPIAERGTASRKVVSQRAA